MNDHPESSCIMFAFERSKTAILDVNYRKKLHSHFRVQLLSGKPPTDRVETVRP